VLSPVAVRAYYIQSILELRHSYIYVRRTVRTVFVTTNHQLQVLIYIHRAVLVRMLGHGFGSLPETLRQVCNHRQCRLICGFVWSTRSLDDYSRLLYIHTATLDINGIRVYRYAGMLRLYLNPGRYHDSIWLWLQERFHLAMCCRLGIDALLEFAVGYVPSISSPSNYGATAYVSLGSSSSGGQLCLKVQYVVRGLE
jgi:hypothetical protein